MPDWAQIQRLAAGAASGHQLPLDLVLGVIQTESSGRAAAWNPEPPYRYLWDVAHRRPFRALTPAEIKSEIPPDDFPAPPNVPRDAEWWGQQASWGLMQVMGGVARECGFAGEFHGELLDPDTGIRHGCLYLAKCLRRWGTVDRAVAAYNAGSPRLSPAGGFENQGYVDKVLAARDAWTARLST